MRLMWQLRRRWKKAGPTAEDRKPPLGGTDREQSRHWTRLGLDHARRGQSREALAALDRALDFEPGNADVHYQRGRILKSMDRWEEALESFVLASDLRQDFTDALFQAGTCLEFLKRDLDAEHAYQSVLALEPGRVDANNNLGVLHFSHKRYALAFPFLQTAVQGAPERADVMSNLALALFQLGRLEEAEESARHAVALAPDMAQAHVTLGLVLDYSCRPEESVACFRRALELQPDQPQAAWFIALACLANGDFGNGWGNYEQRWKRPECPRRPFPFPQWQGEPLEERTILIYGEQGLGDEIMFASCLPDVIRHARHCVVECEPRLERLFQRSFPTASVHGATREGDPQTWLSSIDPVDIQCAIGSLPQFLRTDAAQFPKHQGYLRADPGRVSYWRKRLEALGPGLKVGVSWRGGTAVSRQAARSMPIDQWLSMLRIPGPCFVSLQYDNVDAELRELRERRGVSISHWRDAIDDLDEMAALICALDLVVTVCNATVHLTGALGQPTWVLVPQMAEWRYLRKGDSLPWYPAVRLFRQPAPDDWKAVLLKIVSELEALNASSHAEGVTRGTGEARHVSK